MKRMYPLALLVVLTAAAACTRYSYPNNTAVPALSAQANLASSASPTLLGATANAKIVDVSCSGSDYQLRMAYQHGFEKVTYQDFQYQVYPQSSGDLRRITRPTGIAPIEGVASKGEVAFVIPAAKFEEAESDVVVRLRLKTQTVIEATSPHDIIHISGACR